MPEFKIGEDITATLSHYADGDVGTLEFRLVDLETGDPAVDWASTGIAQTTDALDGPPWVYEATRSSTGLLAGVYQAQWQLPTAGPWVDDDEITLSAVVYGWAPPDVSDLSALIFARVTGEFGALQEWTTTTRPTIAQAQTKIAMAMGLIGAQLPAELGARFHSAARAIVVLTAAILTEPGYWPEDLEDFRSAVEEWRKERDAALKGLLSAIKADDEQDATETAAAAGNSAFNPACPVDPCGDFAWRSPLGPIEIA